MRGPKVFISPAVDNLAANDYVAHFFNIMNEKAVVLNYGTRKRSRSADMVKSFSADIMFLHWPEDFGVLAMGYLQAVVAMVTVLAFKMKGGHVVWFCHNKASHHSERRWVGRILRSFYKTFADTIIVHSGDALEHFKGKKNVFHLAHPAYISIETGNKENNFPRHDALIWGNLYPYKGLDRFIDSYKASRQTFSVLMIGKGKEDYCQYLAEKAKGTNITIQNKFLSDADLEQCFDHSKFILLPYLPSETFCSGALIHSLNSNKIVIGPNLGNFIDVSKEGGCMVYNDFNDLFETVNKLKNDRQLYNDTLTSLQNGIVRYRERNTWTRFADDLLNVVYRNRKKPAFNQEPTRPEWRFEDQVEEQVI